MSNSTLACSVGAVDAQWLFPQERAPSPPRNEGYLSIGSKDLAPCMSDGLQPAPNPRMMTCLDECEALWASTYAKLKTVVAKINATLAEVEAKNLEIEAKNL